jgi:DNA-binding HxlR family transcriptional regulator
MEIELLSENMELMKIGKALDENNKIFILERLLKNDGESTLDQLSTALGVSKTKIKRHLVDLEKVGFVSMRKEMLHPFVIEEICWLTPRGRRLFSALKAIIHRELDLQKIAVEV